MEGFIYPGSNAMEFRGWCGWCCTEISSTDPDRSPLFLSSTLSPGLACLGRTEDVLGAWCQMEMLSLIQQIHCCAEKISRSWRKSRVIAICGNNKGYPSLSPPLQPWAGDSDSLAGCWLWRALRVFPESQLGLWDFTSNPEPREVQLCHTNILSRCHSNKAPCQEKSTGNNFWESTHLIHTNIPTDFPQAAPCISMGTGGSLCKIGTSLKTQ